MFTDRKIRKLLLKIYFSTLCSLAMVHLNSATRGVKNKFLKQAGSVDFVRFEIKVLKFNNTVMRDKTGKSY